MLAFKDDKDGYYQFMDDADPKMYAHLTPCAVRPQPDAAPPSTVTMRQARLALLQSNLLEQVNAAVAAADEATKITWEFSSEVQRGHPFVATLAAALNLTEAQLDDLFTLAASL